MTTRVYLGVDLGGTSAKLALADSQGTIIADDAFSTQEFGTPDAALQQIAKRLQVLMHSQSAKGQAIPCGVGIGVPGLVDTALGVTKFLPNLPTQWRDVPVASTLADRLSCPVHLMNDVRTATLGELRYGIGRHQRDLTFAFFSIGTGIGGGIVIDGNVRLGPLGAAGELGHQTIVADGPRCGCGNHGCLEALASGPAIEAEGARLVKMGLAPKLRDLCKGSASQVTTELMSLAADADPNVAEAIERAAIFIGIAAANVVTILHPQRIVLGGGVSQLGSRLAGPVKDVIQKRVRMFPTDDVTVECSTLGNRAGLLGSIALAMTKPADP